MTCDPNSDDALLAHTLDRPTGRDVIEVAERAAWRERDRETPQPRVNWIGWALVAAVWGVVAVMMIARFL